MEIQTKIPDSPGFFSASLRSVSRFGPQVFFAVHRMNFELPDLGAFEHVEHDVGSRIPACPKFAIKIRVSFDLLATNTEDDVAAGEACLVGRAVGRYARDY